MEPIEDTHELQERGPHGWLMHNLAAGRKGLSSLRYPLARRRRELGVNINMSLVLSFWFGLSCAWRENCHPYWLFDFRWVI